MLKKYFHDNTMIFKKFAVLIVVDITFRMHLVVVRYYHVHTRSTENVPSL